MKVSLSKVFQGVLVSLGALFMFVGVAFAAGGPLKVDPVWDKSSLSFSAGCTANCDTASAVVCNGADSERKDNYTAWELFFAATGNPKNGSVVEQGTVPPLDPGECYTITTQTGVTGNYMFKAYQAEGHPGQGELWSDQCTVGVCEEEEEPPVECSEECYIVRYENRLVNEQCQVVEVSRESCNE